MHRFKIFLPLNKVSYFPSFNIFSLMNKFYICATLVAASFIAPIFAKDIDGRPIESVWANRTTNPLPTIATFEEPSPKWTYEAHSADATLKRTQEKRMFGDWSLEIRAKGLKEGNYIHVKPTKAIPVEVGFDRIGVWIRGERCAFGAARDRETTQCPLFAVLSLSDGSSTNIPMRVQPFRKEAGILRLCSMKCRNAKWNC